MGMFTTASVILQKHPVIVTENCLNFSIFIIVHTVGLNFILFASVTCINNIKIHIIQDVTLSQRLVQRSSPVTNKACSVRVVRKCLEAYGTT